MAMYSQRDCGYQVGMLLFCLGVGAFATGFATPHWVSFQFRAAPTLTTPGVWGAGGVQEVEVEGYVGLWTSCLRTVNYGADYRCQGESSSGSNPGWLTAVKAVECAALGVMGLCLCFYFATNCVVRKAAFTRLLEVAIGLSGLLGATGTGIYLWKSQSDDTVRDSLQDNPHFSSTLSWSFYLNAGGIVIDLLAMILIAVYNTPIAVKRRGRSSTVQGRARPTAPPLSGHPSAASSVQGYRPSGSDPYVISAAMSREAPKIYPSLEGVAEEQE